MSFSFAHASTPVELTQRYDLGISTAPGAPTVVLVVKQAGQGNRGYYSALIKRANTRNARGGRVQLSDEAIARGRAETAELFAQHVLAGWENVTEDGKPVAFSTDAASRLLQALIAPPPAGRPDIFDELRKFCEDADNFRADSVADPVELGKG